MPPVSDIDEARGFINSLHIREPLSDMQPVTPRENNSGAFLADLDKSWDEIRDLPYDAARGAARAIPEIGSGIEKGLAFVASHPAVRQATVAMASPDTEMGTAANPPQTPREADERIMHLAQAPVNPVEQAVDDVYPPSPGELAGNLPSQIAKGTGSIAALPLLGPAAIPAMGASMVGEDTQRKFDQGLSPDAALASGALTGTAKTAIFAASPLGRAVRGLPAQAQSAIKRIVENAAQQAGQQGINVTADVATGQQIDWEEQKREAMVGIPAGVVGGEALHVANRSAQQRRATEQSEAQREVQSQERPRNRATIDRDAQIRRDAERQAKLRAAADATIDRNDPLGFGLKQQEFVPPEFQAKPKPPKTPPPQQSAAEEWQPPEIQGPPAKPRDTMGEREAQMRVAAENQETLERAAADDAARARRQEAPDDRRDSAEERSVANDQRVAGAAEDRGVQLPQPEDVQPVEAGVPPVVGDQGQQVGDQSGDVAVETSATISPVAQPDGAGRTPPPAENAPQRPSGTDIGDKYKLTLDQYISKYARKGQDSGIQRAYFGLNHRRIIEQALREGKKVPAKVLRDHPDLIKPSKEIWQMSQDEHNRWFSGKDYEADSIPAAQTFRDGKPATLPAHEIAIEKALREGKSVPPEVLAEYPHLQKSFNQPAPAPTGGTTPTPQKGTPNEEAQTQGPASPPVLNPTAQTPVANSADVQVKTPEVQVNAPGPQVEPVTVTRKPSKPVQPTVTPDGGVIQGSEGVKKRGSAPVRPVSAIEGRGIELVKPDTLDQAAKDWAANELYLQGDNWRLKSTGRIAPYNKELKSRGVTWEQLTEDAKKRQPAPPQEMPKQTPADAREAALYDHLAKVDDELAGLRAKAEKTARSKGMEDWEEAAYADPKFSDLKQRKADLQRQIESHRATERSRLEQIREPQPDEVLTKNYKPGAGGVGFKSNPPHTGQAAKDAAKQAKEGVVPTSIGQPRGDRQMKEAGKVPPDRMTTISPATGADYKGDGTAKLKAFVRTVPEFAIDPNFTVVGEGKGRQLQFQDGGKYKFRPETLGVVLPDDAVAGERIGIDVEAVKKMKIAEVLLVGDKAVAPRPAPLVEPIPVLSTAMATSDASKGRANAPVAANPRASAFRKQADALTQQVNAKKNPPIAQQNITARRSRIAEGMYKEGERLEKIQNVMRGMADAIERGELPESLAKLSTKAQVEDLMRGSYPRPYVNEHAVRELFDKLKGKSGIADIRNKLGYVSTGSLRSDQVQAVKDLFALAKRLGVQTSSYNIDVSSSERLQRAGINDEQAWNRAKQDLQQFIGERREDPQAVKVKLMERALIGRNIPGFFPTPKTVAERLVDAAGIRPGDTVLEPSAGKGDILDVIKARHPDAKARGLEYQNELAEIARVKGHDVTTGDFLSDTAKADRIVMNPPFERGQDVEHVRRAFDQLNPGGRLVAVMSEGPFFRNDAKATEFREWLEANGGSSEKLEAGSFTGKEAFRQTGTATRMVIIDKAPQAIADSPRVEPPKTGVLDQLESWAETRLTERAAEQAQIAKRQQSLDPSMRRRKGAAGPLDPEELMLRTIIGAAKIGKGAQRFVTWSREMLKQFPEMTRDAMAQVWRSARRFTKMDEDGRAAWVSRVFTKPEAASVKETVRETTGQIDHSRLVSEVDALEAAFRKAQQASKAGYRAGVSETETLRKELVRLAKEVLPPEQRGQLLTSVATTKSLATLRVGINRIRKALADYDTKEAIASAEKLIGTMKLDPIQGPKLPPKLGPKNKPPETFDLNRLAPEYRNKARPLLAKAKALKNALVAGGTTEERYAAIDQLGTTIKEIAEIAAEDRAAKTTRIDNRLIEREAIVADLLKKVSPTVPDVGTTTDSPSNDRGATGLIKRFLGRGSLSMDTIATHLDPEKGDVHDVTIRNVRRAQEEFYREQQRWTEHFGSALETAGYAPGTKKLNDFINRAETVDLPDAGEVKMNRNQMVGLIAAMGDPQTAALVGRGATWNFKTNPLSKSFAISEADFSTIRAKLSPEEIKLVDAFKDYNKNDVTPRLMDAAVRLKGHAPETHAGYFPRARNRAQNLAEGVPEGWRGHFNAALENISSLKERAPDLKQPLLVPEFIQDSYKYMDDAAKLMHLAEPVRTAAMVWEDPRVKSAVQRRFGDSMNRRVDQFLADTMMVRQRPPAEWYDQLSAFTASQISRAWLQFNPSPMAKNILGGPAKLMGEFDFKDWSYGVSKMFSPDVFRRMTKESAVAFYRYNGGLYGQYSPLTGKHLETVAEMRFFEAVKALGSNVSRLHLRDAGANLGSVVDALPFMRYADSIPFRAAFAASEHFIDRTQPGLTGEARTRAVLEKFHDAVYATQNGTSSTEISGLASTARKNALAQPAFLFTSDNNKSYNMLARLKGMSARQRATTLLGVGVNAAVNAGVGFGIDKGVTGIGRAIGGAEEDPEHEKRRQEALIWDFARNIFGIAYGGGRATNIVRSLMSKAPANFGDPVERLEYDVINSTLALGKAAFGYAETVDDSPQEQKAVERIEKSLGGFLVNAQTAAGLPTAPWFVMIRKAIRAGSYQAPDPRDVEKKEEAGNLKRWRESLPGPVQKLLAERNKLTGYSASKLSEAEIKRYDQLAPVQESYERYIRAMREGDKPSADKEMRVLTDAGNGKLPTPDPRAVARRAEDRQTESLRASLPKATQKLLSEQSRLEAIGTDKLSPDEISRLDELAPVGDAYARYLKAARAGKTAEAVAARKILAEAGNGNLPKMDPRAQQRRVETRKSEAARSGLPESIRDLLAEKNRLDTIGKADLTIEEEDRQFDLRELESAYQKWQRAKREGDDAEAKLLLKEMKMLEREISGAAASTAK